MLNFEFKLYKQIDTISNIRTESLAQAIFLSKFKI